MWIKYEGQTETGDTVGARLPLVIALRGHEVVLPGVMPDTVSASIE